MNAASISSNGKILTGCPVGESPRGRQFATDATTWMKLYNFGKLDTHGPQMTDVKEAKKKDV